MSNLLTGAITDIAGILVGHAHNALALTGCTVVLCPGGATGGLDRRGGSTSTRQADSFEHWHAVKRVNAVLLTGGSAFGLSASGGVMSYLEERGIGFGVGRARIPIVAATALYDLGLGDPAVRPDEEMAYRASLAASSLRPESGCVGAGIGASVGKLRGMDFACKSGIGTSSIRIGRTGIIVGALAAVNAFGDIVDPKTGLALAGVRDDDGRMPGALSFLASWAEAGYPLPGATENTVIGVVATNARLSKFEASKVAQMAHDGLARVVHPAHLMFDGDTIFCLATGTAEADVNVVGAYAAEAFTQAILDAVLSSWPLGDLPSARELAIDL